MARRAYGAHRSMTPQQKADNVVGSIRARMAERREWSLDEYGLPEGSVQRRLVEAWLVQHAAYLQRTTPEAA